MFPLSNFLNSFRRFFGKKKIKPIVNKRPVKKVHLGIEDLESRLVPTAGLVASYYFNSATATVLTDVSGNGNNGTIAGATWSTTAHTGDTSSLYFNGTNALVSVANASSLNLTTGMTLEAWVDPTTVSNIYESVIYKGDSNYFLAASSPKGGDVMTQAVGKSADDVYGSALKANTWSFLSATYNGKVLDLYINGTLVSSTAMTASIATSTSALEIGGDNVAGSAFAGYFKGYLDDVRIYNTALTATQIKTDMNTPVTAPALTVSAGASKSVSEGSALAFTGTASGGAGALSYSWNFGDGTPAVTGTLTPSHTYAIYGTYTATLTVTDLAGDTAQSSTTVTVKDVAPTVTIGGPYSGTSGSAIAFTASATDPSPQEVAAGFTYAWKFGDGSTSTLQNPSHTYASSGTYTVTLTVTDEDGVSTKTATTATVTTGLAVSAGPSPSGNEGSAIAFTGTASGGTGTLSYSWSFGDGSAAVTGTLTPTHTYAIYGSYTATLTVTDSAGHTVQSSTTVTVNDVAPTVTVGDPTGIAGTAIPFTASATDPSPQEVAAGFKYSWNFGDGTTSTAQNPSHVFTTGGTFTVTVTATDEDGVSASTSTAVTVIAVAPAPTGVSAVGGNAQIVLSWTASAGATSYNIYRSTTKGGEGSTPYQTGITATTFTDTGLTSGTTYYYEVTAVNTAGESSTSTEVSATTTAAGSGPILAIASAGPATGAFVADTDYSGGQTSSFTSVVNTSNVPSNVPASVFDYQRYGNFTYTLPNLTAGTSYTVVLFFAETYFGSAGSRTFNVTINGAQVLTNFDIYATAGGSNIAVAEQFTATANSSGNIVVQFTSVVNNAALNGIEVLSTAPVVVTAPAAPAGLTATGGSTQAVLSWTASTGATSYDIYRSTTSGGEGSTPYQTGITSTTFTDTGLTSGTTYYYQVAAVNSAGIGAKSTEASATPTAPAPLTISAGPSESGNEGSTISFAGTASGGTGALSYSWSFGDGTAAVTGTLTPSHTYAIYGTYTATLTVTDSAGHTAQSSTTVTVSDVAPTVSIGGPYSVTPGSAIAFTASATDPSTQEVAAGFTYTWNFGDGSTSTAQNPSHTYANAGSYNVTLTVTDEDGVSTTATTTATAATSTAAATPILAISSGNGPAAAPFIADTDFSGGSTSTVSNVVTTGQVGSNVPSSIFDYQRYGTFTYTLPNLKANASYSVVLLFAETYFTSAGSRLFNVSINGTQVLTSFDIFAAAGGQNIAIERQFTAAASSSGVITIQFTSVVDNPALNGIEIFNAVTTAPAAPTGVNATGGNTQTALAWTASPGAVTYNIYRSTTSGGEGSTPYKTGLTSTSFIDNGLTFGTTYYYQVVAVNSYGTSGKSAEVSCTPAIVTNYLTIPNFGASPTITNVGSGNWSNPATWSLDRVPTTGDVVDIEPGTTVTYDVNDSTNSNVITTVEVLSGATLNFSTTVSTQMCVVNLVVLQGGTLTIGTQANPIPTNITAQVVFANVPLNTTFDPGQYGNGLIVLGNFTSYGAAKSAYVTLGQNALAGATTLTLASPESGWQVGDQLYVPDTRELNQTAGGDEAANYVPEWEYVTISSISTNGQTITLSAPLAYSHVGAVDGTGSTVYMPQVADMTRNVKIHSQSATGTRGYSLFTGYANVNINYTSFGGMGRTTDSAFDDTTYSSEGLATYVGTNQQNRNPVTFLDLIGPSTAQSDGYQYTFNGNVVSCVMTPTPFIWGINIVNSFYGIIENTVVVNWDGAGINSDATAFYNTFNANYVARVSGTAGRTDQDMQGDAYWFGNGDNTITNNIATDINAGANGIYSYGFDIDTTPSLNLDYMNTWAVPAYQGADPSIAGESTIICTNVVGILKFANNEVYGATSMGMTTWGLGEQNELPVGTAGTLQNLIVWNQFNWGYFGYESNNLTISGFVDIGDFTQLSNAYTGTTGITFADYMQRGLVITNANIQGQAYGIDTPMGSGWNQAESTTLIENSYLDNEHNICHQPPESVNGNVGMAPMTLVISNVTFSNPPVPSNWEVDDINMNYAGSSGSYGAANYSIPDQVYVVNFNGVAGDDFEVYYSQSAPAGTTANSLCYGALVGPIGSLTFGSTSLPSDAHGTAYSQDFTTTNGSEVDTFALTAGSLPPGLTLNDSTGVLSGTPTKAGTYTFTITATDAEIPGETGSQQYTFIVT
jgi:PKD repeat protein